MKTDKMPISVIMPAYNESSSIEKVIKDLKSIMIDDGSEIIIIDDGSKDNTYSIAKKSEVLVIRHSVNKGYGASIKTGVRLAKNSIIGIIDGDGQHDACDILRLRKYICSNDMVVGKRKRNSHSPLWRQPGKKLIQWVANSLTRTHISDINSGLRLFKKDIVEKYLHLLPNGFSLSTTITIAMLMDGYNIKYVPITVMKRSGQSTVNILDGFKALLLIVRLLMLFSPLRIFIPASATVLLAGTVLFIYDVIGRNIQDITILTILVGFLLFLFGLIVDQMAHIRRELKQ